MSNSSAKDLFNNNFEIPSFDAGTTVPAQTVAKDNVKTTNDAIPMYIGIGIIVLIVIIALSKLLKKSNKQVLSENIENTETTEEKTPHPQVVEIRASKKNSNFATPTNINKCIRLFLENTRIK
ncbi:hypothetical protein IJD15_00235 [bacterium]|nr:hypothetical protein [bacterium]